MSINIPHYNVDCQPDDIKMMIKNNTLRMPCFVGQGCSKRVGSDAYGYYVVSFKILANGKPLVGIARANTVMHGHWTEGDEDCSIDMATAKPDEYITTYGRYRRTGAPKWWYCDSDGHRYSGSRCNGYCWNGAYAYRDPSF